MNRALFMAALAGVALAASPATAKIKDWAIAPSSDEAVVIMRADRQPYEWALWLSRAGQGGFGRRIYTIGVKPHEFVPYTGRTLKPGTYQINSIVQQGAWSTCFGTGTRAFTVEAGKVYHLGNLNTLPLLADLQQSAKARGKTALTRGALAIGWEPTVKPEFFAPSEEELAELRKFVATAMPKTSAAVVPLATTPATFGMTGGEKFMQVCG